MKTLTKYQAEKLLGISGSYTYKELQKAYRHAVKENHPDVGGSAEKMIKVNAAHELLEKFFVGDKQKTVFCDDKDYASVEEEVASNYASASPDAAEYYRERAGYENTAKRHNPNAYTYNKTGRAAGDTSFAEACRAAREAAYDPKTDSVKTKYGWVPVGGNTGWIGNVGVEFKYSTGNSEVAWKKMNDAAEARARQYAGYEEPASKNDSTNENEEATWYDYVEAFASAVAGSYKNEATGYAAQDAYMGASTPNDAAYRAAYAATNAAVGAMDGDGIKACSDRFFGGKYRRPDMDGAPEWWNKKNFMASWFPWRLVSWFIFGLIGISAAFVTNVTTAEFMFYSIVLIAAFLQVFGLVTNPIRRIIRKRADENLEAWAFENGKFIDWEAAVIRDA